MTTTHPRFFDHLRPFFTGLGLRPILVSPVLFLLAVVWLDVGANYGIAAQLWHEDPFKQALAGLGASLLLVQVCLVAYLLDSKADWLLAIPARPKEPYHPVDRQMRWYIDRTWLPLVVLVGAAAFFNLVERWYFLVGLLIPCLVYFLVRWLHSPRPATLAQPAPTPPRSWRVIEVALHVLLAAVGITLIAVIPNHHLEWLCLVLSWWLAGHGMLLYLFRLWQMDRDDHRRMHRRAGLAFGSFFLVYQILFVVYCLDASGELAARIAPPALVCFLLLCLIVTVHGFLEYHFGPWYVLVVLGLLLVMALINGRPRYKLHFPGLDYSDDGRVQLLEGDFEGLFSQLATRHADLKADPDDPEKRYQVVDSYRGLIRSHDRLARRWQDRMKLHGRAPQRDWQGRLPDDEELSKALKAGEFDRAERYYRRWRSSADDLAQRLGQLESDALKAWKKRTAGAGQKPKLIVVAVSGGANRSALWTTFVLDQLEQAFAQENINFAPHVRLVTGASGGMVGAAYWVATLDPTKHRHTELGGLVDRVGGDSLTPLGQHAFFLDLPTLLLPGEFTRDRGVALEQAWSTHLDGALDQPFVSLARGEVEGWRPSLVVSPMMVEDGRRLLISNQYLPFLTGSGGRSLSGPEDNLSARKRKPRESGDRWRPRPTGRQMTMDKDKSEQIKRDRYSLSGVEFYHLFPAASEFRVSTAVRMSATFPYFSPAVDLPTVPRRRVVDAGYYDNYGVNVAAEWLYFYREWLAENTSGVVLVQLRDSSSEQRRLFPDEQPLFWDYTRALEWLTGPLVGAGSAREAGMSFRNDELVQVLSDYFNRDNREQFTTVVFESQVDIAMSWYLTRDEANRMKTGFEKDNAAGINRRSLDRLLRWWKEDHGQP